MKTRGSGVLLNLSSFPSPYGIGTLGEEAKRVVLELCEMGFSTLQILPLSPIDGGNSPYLSVSAFAGNEFYIDPMELYKMGLVTQEEADGCIYPGQPFLTDYDFVRSVKEPLLRKAFSRISEDICKELGVFCEEMAEWLTPYAVFLTAHAVYGDVPWYQWPDEKLRLCETEAVERFHKEHRNQVNYHCFVQYLFFRQWRAFKNFANEAGMQIIGDIPFYVALDSADVWANREWFVLDEKTLLPTQVAGVPPDYFSEEGQLWGNPTYAFEKMERDDYGWWIRRIRHHLSLCDVLRIDHFRGFCEYYAVPAGQKTAKRGRWLPGPEMKLFSEVHKRLPGAQILAEDLGCIDEKVVRFLKKTGYPGMAVMQFGFDGSADNPHLPHQVGKNTVFYSGTHDNNTLLGWITEQSEESREYICSYFGFSGDITQGGAQSPFIRHLMRVLFMSTADRVILPVQDLCGFGKDTRMNVPGVPAGNWAFRLTEEALGSIDRDYIKALHRLYGR